jgi:DNA-nicking Smr family endonuclease
VIEIDLHGLPPSQALRRLGQELHACRQRRADRALVITGRGWGNRLQKPVLRPMVEEWLRGPDGVRLGVVSFEMHSQGGALLVRLRSGGADA